MSIFSALSGFLPSFCQLRLVAPAVLSAFPLLLTNCVGLPKTPPLDEVNAVVGDRTGHQVRLPSSQLEQADVDAYVANLLRRPLTASSAAQVALLKSRRLRATLQELNLSQADLLEASLPSNINLASSLRWPHQGGGRTYEMELAGDVMNWLLLPLRRNLALREYEAAKRRVSHEVLDLVFEVKEAFYEVQSQQQFIARLDTMAEVNRVTSDFAQRLRTAGNITELELLQEQTNVQQTILDQRRTRGELAASREKLNRVLGLTSSESSRWTAGAALPPIPSSDPSLSRVESLAVTQRQDLAAQRETLAALQHGYSLTRKMRYLPALNLGVNTERELDGARVTGPTLEAELPLFNWGQGKTRRSAAEVAQAQATYEALDLEVRSDVRTALAALQAARNVHAQVSGNLLPQRRRILQETLLQYNAMQVSNFDLLRAKENELEAQRDQIEALRDYWVARAELERAAGGTLTPRTRAKAPAPVHVH
jgi:cobalt-zinc-cadmium efflux system outer membrane protein